MPTENILACPFCGGVSIQVYEFDYTAQVECNDCGSSGPTQINDDMSRKERHQNTISAWNTVSERREVARAWTLPED